MSQTKTESFVESCVNAVIGWVIAVVSQLAIFPMFGIHVPLSTNLWISVWFTAISVARSYVIRRWFNNHLKLFTQIMSRAIER